MPPAPDKTELSNEVVGDLLRRQRRIILVTNGPDGLPHPLPMGFAVDELGRVIMTSFRDTQKVRNIERDPRATLLLECADAEDGPNYIQLYCDAEIADGCEEVARSFELIGQAGEPSSVFTPEMRAQIEASFPKRVVLRFTHRRNVCSDD